MNRPKRSFRVTVLLPLLTITSIVILLPCESTALGADNTLFDELNSTLSTFRKTAELNINPKDFKRTVVGFWGPESWAEPLLDKNGRVDPQKIYNCINEISSGRSKERNLYSLYKTLPYIQDLHESSLGRDIKSLGIDREIASLFDSLSQGMSENPYEIKTIDPLTLKQNIILLLQKEALLPDYQTAFTEAKNIISIANDQLKALNGSEPPDVKERLESIVEGTQQTIELLALQYTSTMYQGGKFSSESESYQELQGAIQEGVLKLTEKLAEAISVSGSGAETAYSQETNKLIKEIVQDVTKKATKYHNSLFFKDDYGIEYSGLSGLIDSAKTIKGSKDALGDNELAGKLDKLAKDIKLEQISYERNKAAYEQKCQNYTKELSKKVQALSNDELLKYISDKMQAGHQSMHAGDYLGAVRHYEEARLAESQLSWTEKFGRGLSGYADPKDYIAKAMDAMSHPGEYDIYYDNLDHQLGQTDTKNIISKDLTVTQKTAPESLSNYQSNLVKAYKEGGSKEREYISNIAKQEIDLRQQLASEKNQQHKSDSIWYNPQISPKNSVKYGLQKIDEQIQYYSKAYTTYKTENEKQIAQSSIEYLKRVRSDVQKAGSFNVDLKPPQELIDHTSKLLEMSKATNYVVQTMYSGGDKTTSLKKLEEMVKNEQNPEVRAFAADKLKAVQDYYNKEQQEKANKASSASLGISSVAVSITGSEGLVQEAPKTVSEHQQLAEAYRKSGDYKRAAEQEHKAQNLKGIKFSRFDKLTVNPEIKAADIDTKSGRITFIGKSGQKYTIDAEVRKEIMDVLLYLHTKAKSVFDLGFTLTVTKEESDRCEKEVEEWLTKNKYLANEATKIDFIKVKNTPHCLGYDYSNTILGKIALDADVALKYITNGLHPTEKTSYFISQEFKTLLDKKPAGHYRFWLVPRTAEINMSSSNIKVDVTVGIEIKAIRYITNEDTEDIEGEVPVELKRLVQIIEENYDKIARDVPSWRLLKEAYRGFAILQFIDVLSSIPQIDLSENEICSYSMPSSVNGLACYSQCGTRYSVGGIDLGLRGEEGINKDSLSPYWKQLYEFGSKEANNPYCQAIVHFMRWDIDGVIKQCSETMRSFSDDSRLLNLRANAYCCKALDIRKPSQFYDPVLLSEIIGNKVLKKWENGENLPENINAEFITKALADYKKASSTDLLIPYVNMTVLNAIRDLPGQQWEKKAFDVADENEKFRLHNKAASLYMQTGSFAKAAKRIEYLCYKKPDDLSVNLQLIEAYLKEAQTSLPPFEQIPRILVLPLKNVTNSPKDSWISSGAAYLLRYAANKNGQVQVISPSVLENARKAFGYTEKEIYEVNFLDSKIQTIANLYNIKATHIVSGTYIKFGSITKFSLQVFNRKNEKTNDIELKGNIQEPHKLLKNLYDEIVFEVIEKVSKDAYYDDLPQDVSNLEIWCKVRDFTAKSDKNALKAYLGSKLAEGISEASLSQAELLVQQQQFEKAIEILKAAAVNQSSLWRKYYLIGLCNYGLGRTTDSQNNLQQAFELNNHSQLPLLVLREVMAAGPEKYFVDKKLMEMGTQLPEPYIESAAFLATIGEKLEALKCLRLLLRNNKILNRKILKSIEKIWWEIAHEARYSKVDTLLANRK